MLTSADDKVRQGQAAQLLVPHTHTRTKRRIRLCLCWIIAINLLELRYCEVRKTS